MIGFSRPQKRGALFLEVGRVGQILRLQCIRTGRSNFSVTGRKSGVAEISSRIEHQAGVIRIDRNRSAAGRVRQFRSAAGPFVQQIGVVVSPGVQQLRMQRVSRGGFRNGTCLPEIERGIRDVFAEGGQMHFVIEQYVVRTDFEKL